MALTYASGWVQRGQHHRCGRAQTSPGFRADTVRTGPWKPPQHSHHCPRNTSLSGRPWSFCSFVFFSFGSFFGLAASSSKFRIAVFDWCRLGYTPEPQLQSSLGRQAFDICSFHNGRARAPPRLMRWEIP